MDIRRKFLTQRVVTHWATRSSAAVDAPSLGVFKARLVGILGSLIYYLI